MKSPTSQMTTMIPTPIAAPALLASLQACWLRPLAAQFCPL
jgi:hypothetical protein